MSSVVAAVCNIVLLWAVPAVVLGYSPVSEVGAPLQRLAICRSGIPVPASAALLALGQ